MKHPPSSASPTQAASSSGLSSRARRWGSVVAVVVLAAIIALAWYLTHRAPAPTPGVPGTASAAGARGKGGPGGGRPMRGVRLRARSASPPRARRHPGVLDALGTVTPAGTRDGAAAGLRRDHRGPVHRRADGPKGQLLATIDPRPFEMALQQAIGARLRDEAQLETPASRCSATGRCCSRIRSRARTSTRRRRWSSSSRARWRIDRAVEGTARLNSATAASSRRSPAASACARRRRQRHRRRRRDRRRGDHAARADRRRVRGAAGPRARGPGSASPRARAAGRPRSTARARRSSTTARLLDARQPDRRPDRHRARPRRASRTRAGALFPEPVRQRAAAAAHDRRRPVVVPVTALRHGPSGDYVYVVQRRPHGGDAHRDGGEADVNVVAMTSGLEAGEQVVTEGGDRLKDGARIQLAGDRPAGRPGRAASRRPRAVRRGGRRPARGAEAAAAPDVRRGASATRGCARRRRDRRAAPADAARPPRGQRSGAAASVGAR